MKRRSLSTRERARLFTLHGGRCYLCGARIDDVREAWEVEHVLPLALGGDDSDDNRRPAHARCHKPKTAADVGAIRKADRRRARHTGAKARSRRSFLTNRDGPFKQTFRHGTVRRER